MSATDGPYAPGANARFESDNRQFVGDYTNPILKPRAAEAVRKQGEIELSGVSASIPSNQCWPEPVSYIFFNFGMQMLQQPGKITILYDEDHAVRHVSVIPVFDGLACALFDGWIGTDRFPDTTERAAVLAAVKD